LITCLAQSLAQFSSVNSVTEWQSAAVLPSQVATSVSYGSQVGAAAQVPPGSHS